MYIVRNAKSTKGYIVKHKSPCPQTPSVAIAITSFLQCHLFFITHRVTIKAQVFKFKKSKNFNFQRILHQFPLKTVMM